MRIEIEPIFVDSPDTDNNNRDKLEIVRMTMGNITNDFAISHFDMNNIYSDIWKILNEYADNY